MRQTCVVDQRRPECSEYVLTTLQSVEGLRNEMKTNFDILEACVAFYSELAKRSQGSHMQIVSTSY